MNGLKVIENNLVPVYETSAGEKVVYGSELHESLGAPSVYREWIKRRISDIDAVENEDFQGVEISTPSGQTRKDHIIKLDIAKEMAMLERNEKGRQVRKYFIAVEKKYNRRQAPMTIPEQIQLLAMGNVELDKKIADVKQELDNFKMDMPVLGIEEYKITNAVRRKGTECLGGKDTNAYNDRSIRSKVYSDIYRELKRQFGITTYKAIKRSQCDTALSVIDSYKVPMVIAQEIRNCNAQIGLDMEAI